MIPLADLLFAEESSKAFLDAAQPSLDNVIRYILHDDVIAIYGAGLRNTVTHRACAYDANIL